MPPPKNRSVRADAQRNRERLLAAATRAFAEHGADVTPRAIARDAGVGVGTLYRHFPTRETLIDAAYRSDLQQLCDSVSELLSVHAAADALRMWMDRFIDHAITKRGMSDALGAVIGSDVESYAESRSLLTAAVTTLLKAGADDGTLRTGLDSDDLLIALAGIALASSEYGDRDQAKRLIVLLLRGLTEDAGAG
jgi:AcrR family transcriptional regulator